MSIRERKMSKYVEREKRENFAWYSNGFVKNMWNCRLGEEEYRK